MQNPSVKKKRIKIDSSFLKIGQAAQALGVSIDTLRRWEKAGKISTVRTPGGTRLYHISALKEINPAAEPYPIETYQTDSLSTEELLKRVEKDTILGYNDTTETEESIPNIPISQYPNIPSRKSSLISKFLIGSAFVSTITLLLTSWITASYLTQPKSAQQFFKNNIASPLFSPFHALAEEVITVIDPRKAKELGFAPPEDPPPIATNYKLRTLDSSVLAVTASSQFLEVNADTQINGALFVRDSVNGLSLEATPSANSFVLGSGDTTLTVTNDALLDQDVSTLASPTFNTLNLSATSNQLVFQSSGSAGGTLTWTPTAARVITLPDATGTVLLDSATQTITNKTINASNNTITNISNSALANSKVTVTAGTNLTGGGDINLGSSATISLKDSISLSGTLTAGGVVKLADGTAAAPGLTFTNDTDTGLYRIGANSIGLITGGSATSGITIDASGNVGIGTISPSYTLDVTGRVNGSTALCIGGDCKTAWSGSAGNTASNGLTLSGVDLQLGGSLTRATGIDIASQNFGFLGGNVGIGTTSAGGSLVVASGNVGIGFTSPDRTTQIASDINITPSLASLLGANGTQFAITGSTAANLQKKLTFGLDTSDNYGVIQVGNTSGTAYGLVLNPAGGNVGIGTTNLNARIAGTSAPILRVVKSDGVGGGTIEVQNTTSGGGDSAIDFIDSNGNIRGNIAYYAQRSASDPARFVINQGTWLAEITPLNTILNENGGNVGIGTTGPLSLLSVAGNAHIGNLYQSISAPTNGLFVDGNVGIGATTSSNKLDVWGNSRLAGTLTVDSTSTFGGSLTLSSGQFLAPNGTASLPSYSFTNSTSTGMYSPSANALALNTNGASTPPLTITAGGNVGIGITNPGSALTVIGNVGIGTSAAGAALQVNGGGLFGWGTASSALSSGAIAAFNGNVGIGTTSPAANLEVIPSSNSYLRLFSTTDAPAFQMLGNGDNTNYAWFELGRKDGNQDRWQMSMAADGSNRLRFIALPTNSENLSLLPGGNVGIGASLPQAKLVIQGNVGIGYTGVNQAIPVNGLAIFGNVGIGTTTANSNLSISGNAHIGSLYQGISAPTNGLFVDGNVGIGATTSSNKLDVWGNARIAGTTTIDSTLTALNGLIGYSGVTAPSNGLAVSGNLGIGTTSPAAALEVIGAAILRGNLTFNADNSFDIGAANATRPRTGYFGTSVQSGVAMDADVSGFFGTPMGYFAGNASSNIPVVIVGTGANTYGAEINGLKTRATSTNANTIVQNNDELMALQAFGADGASYRQAAGIYFYVDGTPGSSDMPGRIDFATSPDDTITPITRMTIKNTGNIGIGATLPQAKLVIQGNVGIGYTGVNQAIPDNGLAVFGNVGIGTTTANSNLSISGNAHIGSLYQGTVAPTNGLFVDGNVGIGATTSSNKLDVWGAANITGNVGIGSSLTVGSAGVFSGGLVVNGGSVVLPAGSIGNSELENSSITVSATAGTGISVAGSPVSLGGTLTVSGIDASTTVKGVASFNSTNFSVSSGAVNTIQDIATTSSPTFVGLSLSSGNLGIGTSTTGAKLQVNGGGIFWPSTASLTGPANGLAVFGNVGIGTTSPNNKLQVIGAGVFGADYGQYSASANGLLIQGNVGIGATTSSNKLDVWGNARIAGTLTVDSTLTNSSVFRAANGSATAPSYSFTDSTSTGLWSPSANALSLTTNGSGTSGITIAANGNVGIGVTAPAALLHISNTSDALSTIRLSRSGSSNDWGVYRYGSSGSDRFCVGIYTVNEPFCISTDGNVGIGLTTANSQLSISNNVHIGSLYQGTVAPTNGLFVDGNVGIGATTSSNKLDVWGAANITGNVGIGASLTVGSAGVFSGGLVVNGGSVVLPAGSIGNSELENSSITVSATAGTGISVSGSPVSLGGTLTVSGIDASTTVKGVASFNSTNFSVSSGAVNTIQDIATTSSPTFVGLSLTSGNLGIGTSATGAKLQVNGNGIFWPSTTSLTGPTNGLAVFGNVGIGTTTANSNLSVAGSAHIGALYQSIAAPANGLFVDGNVGIGATTSSNKLDVWGNSRIAGNLTLDGTLTTNGTITPSGQILAIDGSKTLPSYSFASSGNGDNGMYLPSANALSFSTAGNDVLTLTAGGNVGIGTTSPVYQLETSGSVGIGGSLTVTSGTVLSGGLSVSGGSVVLPSGSIQNSELENSSITVSATAGTGISVSGSPVSLGGTLTVSGIDASTTVKGVASFNSTNFSVSSGAVNTIQDIATTSSPTFVGLSLTSGNLGIGTSATGAKLQVNGNGIFWPSTTALTGPTNGLAVFGNVGIGTTTPLAPLHTWGNGTNSALFLNGNVGIGFTTPDRLTQLASDINITGSLASLLGAAGTQFGITGNSGSGGTEKKLVLGIDTTDNYGVIQAGAVGTNYNLALNPAGGNVGIGTTSPAAPLHIVGATAQLRLSGNGTTQNTAIDFYPDTPSGTGYRGQILVTHGTDADAGKLQLQLANTAGTLTTRLYIEDGGNLGIGTDTTPDYLLELYDATNTPAFGLSDDDVAHGVTTIANTDTFFHLSSISTTVGGAQITGLADATGVALGLKGIQSSDPTDSTPAISLIGAKANGTGVQDLADAETILQIANNDNAAALTILGNGNVGIGATIPNAILSIQGNVGIGYTGANQVIPANGLAVFGNVGIGTTTANSNLSISGNAHIGALYQGISAPTNGLFVDGNVGIGATTSSNKLDVWGNARIAGTLTVDSTITPTGQFLAIDGSKSAPSYSFASSGNGDNGMYLPSANALSFSTAGNDVLTLTAGGNVGIGITNPGSALTVIGNVGIGTSSTGAKLQVNGEGLFGWGTASVTGPANGLGIFGNVGIGTTSPNSKLSVIGGGVFTNTWGGAIAPSAGLIVEGNTGIGVSAPVQQFQVNPNGSSAFTVTSSGFVGIGKTSPGVRLDILNGTLRLAQDDGDAVNSARLIIDGRGATPVNASIKMYADTATLTPGVLFHNNAGTAIGRIGLDRGTSTVYAGASQDDMVVGTDVATNKVLLGTNSIARLTVDSAGNIGIGTTTANSLLSVAGGAHIGALYQSIAAPANGLFVDGNVGIGATTSSNKLDVWGNAAITGNLTLTGNLLPASNDTFDLGSNTARWNNLYLGPATLHIGTSTSDEYTIAYDTTNDRLGFNVNGSGPAEIVMDSNGNVGIGITNPAAKLEVDQTTGDVALFFSSQAANDNAIRFRTNQGDSSIGLVLDNSNTNKAAGMRMQPTTGSLTFNTGLASGGGLTTATEKMQLDTNGNLGIGTQSPIAQLDVRNTNTGTGLHTYIGSSAGQFGILNNGNVGIGTTTPGEALHVVDNNGRGIKIERTSSTASSWSWRIQSGGQLQLVQDSGGANDLLIQPTAAKSLIINEDSADADLRIESDINAGAFFLEGSSGNIGIGTTSPLSLLSVAGNAHIGSIRQGISAPTDGLFVDGNVGIGATTSSNKLDVWGNANITGTLNVASNLFQINSSGFALLPAGLASTPSLSFVGDTDTGLWWLGTNFLALTTNGAGALQSGTTINGLSINANGNVGIGTTNPTAALDVAGATSTISNTTGNLTITPASNLIISSGNVGIGFTSPDRKLQIGSDIDITGTAASILGANGAQFSITGSSANTTHKKLTLGIDTTDNYGVIQAGNTNGTAYDLALQPGGGNVGIGTTSPSTILGIGGSLDQTTYWSTSYLERAISVVNHIGTDNKAMIHLEGNQSFGNGVVDGIVFRNYQSTHTADDRTIAAILAITNTSYDAEAGNLAFYTHDTTTGYAERMRIDSGGNVGVGYINSPGAVLSVNGNVGIGTSSPASSRQLTLNTSTDLTLFAFSEANVEKAIIGYDSGGGSLITTGPNNLKFSSAGGMVFGTGAAVGPTPRMTIDNAGNVGIGYSVPAASLFSLTTNGPACSKANAGDTAFTACSSRDIKENIVPVSAEGILDKIANVPANTYDFINGDKNKMGLIAEDFYTVFNRGDGKSVNGQEVQMATWLGIQQLYQRDQQLRNAIYPAAGGNIGIGTSNPQYTLEVNGTGKLNDAAWTYASDLRLKENIASVSAGLSIIEQLNPVTFDYIQGGRGRTGFIAQEVQNVLPNLVTVGSDGMLGLRTEEILPYTVRAIQEQQVEINNLIANQATSSALSTNLSVSADGTLNVPKLQADKITLSADIDFATAPLNALISTTDGTGITSTAGGGYDVDVLASLNSISTAVLGVQTQESTTSAQLANLETTVASQSANLASLESNIASQSATTQSLAEQLASAAAELAQTRSDVEELKLTPPDILLATQSAQLVDLTVTSDATVSGQLTAYDLDIQNSLKSLGTTTLGSTLVAGDFTVDGTLTLTGSSVSTLSTLYIQNGSLAGPVDFFNGLVTIDKTGKLIAQEIITPSVVTNKLTISNIPIASSSATLAASIGSAKLPAGVTKVVILTNNITDTSKVFITPRSSTSGQAPFVELVEPNTGFVVSIDSPVSRDIDFDWWIVETR